MDLLTGEPRLIESCLGTIARKVYDGHVALNTLQAGHCRGVWPETIMPWQGFPGLVIEGPVMQGFFMARTGQKGNPYADRRQ